MSDLKYTLGLDAGGFAAAASRAVSMLGSMELAVQGINRAASALASSFNEAASMERTATAIGTITKNARVTEQVMSDLKKLSADTPFEMSDLAPAARALLGAGTAAGTVADQLKMLGDIASAADTDIGGIVSVFNQVRGKGKLLTDDFIQLAERGVAGLREEIAKFKGISVDSVADSLSKGLVSAKDLEAVFGRMTGAGGIAFQAMERQAQTFTGKLSTLSDAWTGLQIAFAEPINDALKPVIDDMTRLTETLAPAFGIIGEEVGGLVEAAHNFILEVGQGGSVVAALGSAFGDLFATLGDFAGIPLGALKEGMPEIGAAFMLAVAPVGDWLAAKLTQAAYAFGAVMQEMMADAASVMADVGNNMMNDVMKGIPDVTGIMGMGADLLFPRKEVAPTDFNAKAAATGQDAQSIKLDAQLGKSLDLFAEGMDEIIRSMGTRLDAFLGNAPARVDTASFIDRLAAAAGTPAAATTAGSVSNNDAVLNKLDSIFGELQRINTQ